MDPKGKQARLLTLGVSLIVIAALYLARDVLVPFALAALVSFLLNPLVRKMQRRGLRRMVAVAIAMLGLMAGVGALGWIVVSGARQLANNLPEYQENIQHKTSFVRELVQKPFERATTTVKDLSDGLATPEAPSRAAPPTTVQLAAPKQGAFEILRSVFGPILGGLTVLAMALLFAVIMLLRPEDLRDRVIRLIGGGKISLTTQALDEASDKVSSYLAHQLLVNGSLGIAASIGLLIIGVPNALLWGLLLIFLRFLPYVGIWIATLFPILISLATSDGWAEPLQITGLFVVLEVLGGLVLEPWLYSSGTGISPLAVLVSALFWSWLWGPIGLILATPLTVCLVVLGKYIPQLQVLHLLFSDVPALPPGARVYQRLLAQDVDDAWSIVKAEAPNRPLHELFDSILLPALALSESERKQGSVDEESLTRIHEGFQLLVDECEDPALTNAAREEVPTIKIAEDLRVLCMPARNAADVLGAQLLDRVLRAGHIRSTVASLSEFVGETIESLKVRPVDVVIVSAVPPSRLMHVRYICKRLAAYDPDLEIVVGLWTLDIEAPVLAERLPDLPRVHVVTSLKESLATLAQIQPRAKPQQRPRGGLANSA